MTISDGMYATLQLYLAIVVFIYCIIMIAFLFSLAIAYLFWEEPEVEQARLTKYGE